MIALLEPESRSVLSEGQQTYGGPAMAKALDPKDFVSFKEFVIANSIQVDALTQLLIEEGLINEQKFYAKLKEVQAQYKKRKSHA
jgi:hypothetical protein